MSAPFEPTVVLQTQRAGRPIWLRGRRPLRVLAAQTAADAAEVLAAVDEGVSHGLSAAGFLTYEASPGFDAALATVAPGPLPAVWFTLFEDLEALDELPAASGPYRLGDWRPSIGPGEHARAVEAIRAAIARGETYQANFTYRLRASFSGDPWGLFLRLLDAQRPAHAAYLDLGDHVLVSVSPELFFTRRGKRLICQPMKGTMARGRTTEEDRSVAAALRASEKDRAENLMIVDMVRNDLGRIARPGSVEVPELFTLERYPSLWQLTSTVRATTDAPTAEVIAALFPAASITGAPKVRTTEILRRLESSARGIYTGAIGWLAPGDRASFNVAIRTVHIRRRSGRAEYGTGGGIVWDSRPESELAEARTKAAILVAEGVDFELFETLLWRPQTGYWLLERHLARLVDSAAYFDRTCNANACRRELEELSRSLPPLPHRVRLFVGGGDERRLEVEPLARSRRTWRLAFAREPIDPTDRLLFHKTSRRRRYEEARADRPCHDDALLWSPAGEVTETTVANLVARIDGFWVTPPVASGLLPGTLRAALLDRGWLEERPLSISTLRRAERVLLVNSLRGIVCADIDWDTAPDRSGDHETRGSVVS